VKEVKHEQLFCRVDAIDTRIKMSNLISTVPTCRKGIGGA